MPCDCSGYPEPSLAEQLERRELEAKRRFDELFKCHGEVVAERDYLLARVAELERAIVDRAVKRNAP
jgi:hypothetical protein